MADLSQLTDEQLDQLAQSRGIKTPQNQPSADLSSLSDEQLDQLAESRGIKQDKSSILGNVAMGLPQGLGNAAIGAFQSSTDLGEKAASLIEKLYYGDNIGASTFGDRLAGQVKQRNEQQAQLPTSERVGIAIGETLPYLTSGVGTGKVVAAKTGSKITGLAAGGAVGGATIGALSPQEEAGLENRVVEAGKGAAIGGLVGGGLGVATKVGSSIGKGVSKLGKDVLAGYRARPAEAITGFTSKPIETLDNVSAAIKEGSSDAYKAMRESGAVLKPETTKSIFVGIDDALKESGILNPRLHSDTIGILDDVKKLARSKKGKIGLEELDQYRKLLAGVVKKDTNIAGHIGEDALKANIAIHKLDDVVEGLGGKAITGGNQQSIDLLNTARSEWKRYRKFDTITNIVKKADGDPNRTKTLLQNFVNNPKNLRGFSEAEKTALKTARTNSTSEGLMKMLGKFGLDIGSGRNAGSAALPVISAAGAGAVGGFSSAGLTLAVGTTAKQIQKLSARGQIDQVLRLIQSKEPQIVSKAIQKLSPKTRDFVLTNILTQSVNKGGVNDKQSNQQQ